MLMFDIQAAHRGWLRSNLALVLVLTGLTLGLVLVLVLVLLLRLGLILVIGLRLPALQLPKKEGQFFRFERQLKIQSLPPNFATRSNTRPVRGIWPGPRISVR